jgi:hypothetical protein
VCLCVAIGEKTPTGDSYKLECEKQSTGSRLLGLNLGSTVF